MYIIVGLGNPGRKYAGTRHNVGFEVVDKLAHDWGIKITESKFRAFAGEGRACDRKVMLVKPTTYMNLSGECVRDILEYYKFDDDMIAERLIVVYDEVALPVGKVRVRERGSAGGHNGIKNILYQLETEDFLRVRLGVGAKPERMELSNYVLSVFAKDEIEDITFGIIDAADAVKDIIANGVGFAMNKHNPAPKPPPKPKVEVASYTDGREEESETPKTT